MQALRLPPGKGQRCWRALRLRKNCGSVPSNGLNMVRSCWGKEPLSLGYEKVWDVICDASSYSYNLQTTLTLIRNDCWQLHRYYIFDFILFNSRLVPSSGILYFKFKGIDSHLHGLWGKEIGDQWYFGCFRVWRVEPFWFRRRQAFLHLFVFPRLSMLAAFDSSRSLAFGL